MSLRHLPTPAAGVTSTCYSKSIRCVCVCVAVSAFCCVLNANASNSTTKTNSTKVTATATAKQRSIHSLEFWCGVAGDLSWVMSLIFQRAKLLENQLSKRKRKRWVCLLTSKYRRDLNLSSPPLLLHVTRSNAPKWESALWRHCACVQGRWSKSSRCSGSSQLSATLLDLEENLYIYIYIPYM